jgi:hypothetical protein
VLRISEDSVSLFMIDWRFKGIISGEIYLVQRIITFEEKDI